MISVVIPVLNGGADLARCLDAIERQVVGEEVEIVVVDSGSQDDSVEAARAHGARVHEIPPAEFGHGRTRNLGAELARGETLVFTSQDAVAASETWLATLVRSLADGEGVAGAYGRQLPHDDATPPERYFLDFLYGPDARVQRLDAEAEPDFEQTLFSNVNSAIPRAVWQEFPFADDLIMSEDQEWSRRVLRAGTSSSTSPRRRSTTRIATRSPTPSAASSTRASPPSTRTRLATPAEERCDGPAHGTRAARSNGSGRPVSADGSRTRPSTSSRSSRGCSSAGAINGCHCR